MECIFIPISISLLHRKNTGQIDFFMGDDKNSQTTMFLECTPRQKCVENNIGWPRTLGLSCPEKLYLYWALTTR